MTHIAVAPHALHRPAVRPAISLLDGFRLQMATGQHTGAIDALRQRAYSSASYFSLPDPRAVMRRTDPRESMCLIVARGREVIATVRVTYAADRPTAETILEGAAQVPADFFPAVAVCRGATDPAYRGLGLMAFLVSMSVRIAHHAGLGSALAVQCDEIPHYPAMQAAGWQKKPIGSGRMATVGDHSALRLVYLGRERFEASIAHSVRVHQALYERFDVDEVLDSSFWVIHKQRTRVQTKRRLLPARLPAHS